MITKTITVVSGLESRPAALFVQNAGRWKSNITIAINEKKVNAKSIMGVISLGILDGQEVTLCADGEDEKDALNNLANFLKEEHSE
jgi:phosphotransferase system HPr (HPr) family protein